MEVGCLRTYRSPPLKGSQVLDGDQPMAGKSWQPSEAPHSMGEMKVPITPIKSVIKRGDREGGMQITKLMHDNPKQNYGLGDCCEKFIL